VSGAATAGKRYAAWLVLAINFAWAIWLAPLIYGYAIPPANDALLLAGWVLAVAIAAEAYRFRAERVAATRATRQIDQRRRQSEERLRVARDLHDVIGHNISLINVQASMGLDLIDSQPEQARAALSAIKPASKEALEEQGGGSRRRGRGHRKVAAAARRRAAGRLSHHPGVADHRSPPRRAGPDHGASDLR
jgi:signal transduction histidine kinase